jgi:hypothetical protein
MFGVPTGLIDLALHPPLGTLTNHLDSNGPYTAGSHTLTTWNDGGTTKPVSNTFGVLVIANGAIPIKWGYQIGWDDPITAAGGTYYEGRIIQVVVQHQLLLGLGGWVDSEIFDINRAMTLCLWATALPGRIGLYVAPGWAFDLQYLLAL